LPVTIGQRRPAWRRYLPIVIWLAVIYFASTSFFTPERTSGIIDPILRTIFPGLDSSSIDLLHILVRKLAHTVEFAILAIIVAVVVIGSSHPWLRRWWFAVSLLSVVLVAISDEFHQSFVPRRTASIRDVLIDTGGGLIALGLVAVWRRVR
jgi:VanZ family protein